MKNKVFYSVFSVALAASLVSCAAGGAGSEGDETIRVAVIPPTSGALAEFGTGAREGWEFAAKQANENGGVAGRQVELVFKDTDGSAATTLQSVREAVNQDGINFIGGIMTSTEHGAVNAQLEGLNALSFNSNGKDDALTGADCRPNAFRTVSSNLMDMRALGDALSEMPGEKWAIQAVDYSTGHDAAEIFKEAAAAAGKEVVLEQYSPLNTTEFGTYITNLKDSGADSLFSVVYGADAVSFLNQASQFGLLEQFDAVMGFNMVSEPLFETLGEKVLGIKNNVGYNVESLDPLNTRFVEEFEQLQGEAPYYVQADAYIAAQTLFAGIEAADSTDPIEVRDALNDLNFETVVGEVTMRGADHQLLRPSYVGEVVQGEDGLKFEIIETASADVTSPEASDQCQM